MNPIIGFEAGKVFRDAVKAQRRVKQSPEFTYTFIQEAFKALANGKGNLELGNKQINVKDLGFHDLKALCKLSKNFFESEKDLTVSDELLRNIETVKQSKQYKICLTDAKTGRKTYEGLKNLDSVTDLIFLNENPEIESGVHLDLQNKLRDEIKTNASRLIKMRRTARIKKAVIVTAGVAVAIAAVAGAIALFAIGFVFTPIALFIIGPSVSIWALVQAVNMVDRQVERAQRPQDNLIWAFELLKDANAFQVFCQQRELNPQSVTVESMIKNRYKKVTS